MVGLNPCCNGRWSRTVFKNIVGVEVATVLILVVMEDGLVHDFMLKFHNDLRYQVLILVVMEDGLVQIMKISVKGGGAVLILVVMEDGLVQHLYYDQF